MNEVRNVAVTPKSYTRFGLFIVIACAIASNAAGDPNTPMPSIEGNWLVQWHDTPEKGKVLQGALALNKRWSRRPITTESGQRYWVSTRDPESAWHAEGKIGDDYGGSYEGTPQASATGQIVTQHGYGFLGHWGGLSKLSQTGPDTLEGQWTYRKQGGAERWQRVTSRVTRVVFHSDISDEVVYGQGVGRVEKSYNPDWWGPGNSMRGNRPTFWIQIYGQNLWGHHVLNFRDAPDLELLDQRYIFQDGRTHSRLWHPERTVGIQATVVIWPGFTPGRKVLLVDDMEIPFDFIPTGYYPAKTVQFMRPKGEGFVQTNKLYLDEPFYVHVGFDGLPQRVRRDLVLTFDNGDRRTLKISTSKLGLKIYDTSELHLRDLAQFDPALGDGDTPKPVKSATSPYTDRADVHLHYEEDPEGPPTQGPRAVTATIDGIEAEAEILMRGLTQHAVMDVPLRLKLRKDQRSRDTEFYLEVGQVGWYVDSGIPEASTTILREEVQSVHKRLKQWRKPLEGRLKQQWDKEGLVTIAITEPFERLEKFGTPQVLLSRIRPLNLSGEDLAPIVKMLYGRLMQKRRIEQRMKRQLDALKTKNVKVERVAELAGIFKEEKLRIETLDEYFRQYSRALENPNLGRFDVAPWQRRIDEIQRRIRQAERDLAKAKLEILVQMGEPITVRRHPGPGVVVAMEKRDSLREQAERLKEYLESQSNVDQESKKRIEGRIEAYQDQADVIETLINEQTRSNRRFIESLKAELTETKTRRQAARQRNRQANEAVIPYHEQYLTNSEIYAEIVAKIHAQAASIQERRLNLPTLPSLPSTSGDVTPERLDRARGALGRAQQIATEHLENQEAALKVDFVAYLEVERSYEIALGKVTEAMRISVQAAQRQCEDPDKSEQRSYQLLRGELDRITSVINEAEGLYSNADSRLEHFENLLDYVGSSKGRDLVSGTRDRMETLGSVASRFKEYAGHADLLLRGVETYQEGRPQDYLKYTLDVAGQVAGKLPVRGGVIGQFLGFYAEAGVACLNAAHDLRDRIVENELAVQFDMDRKGRPEHRLYTRAQINEAVFHGTYAYDSEEKIVHLATMWQLRRLMFLLRHAGDNANITDTGGLPY